MTECKFYTQRKRILDDHIQMSADVINKLSSVPPHGMCKVVNLYVNPDTGKFIVEYDNTPQE